MLTFPENCYWTKLWLLVGTTSIWMNILKYHMKINIRVVRAITDMETTEKYIDGHYRVLETYGVTKVTSADRSWVNNPHVYLLLVELADSGRIVGGGRIQMRSENFPLPLEGAIFEKDESIVDFMSPFKDLEVAEYCGLWNSREIAGYGIGSIYLIRIGVALSSFLGIKNLMAFCSPVIVKKAESVGFEIITSLGDEGKFLYPKEGLIATIMEIQDINNIPTATDDEQEFIFNLRANPVQFKKDTSRRGDLEIFYDLAIQNVLK